LPRLPFGGRRLLRRLLDGRALLLLLLGGRFLRALLLDGRMDERRTRARQESERHADEDLLHACVVSPSAARFQWSRENSAIGHEVLTLDII
jgi:hypothetical protein